VTSSQENSKPKTEFSFSVETISLAESAVGLNTSLALEAGELWPKEYRPLQWPGQVLGCLTKGKITAAFAS